MLLVLTIVAVTGIKHKAGQILLMEIIDDVKQILNQSSSTVRSEMYYLIWFIRELRSLD